MASSSRTGYAFIELTALAAALWAVVPAAGGPVPTVDPASGRAACFTSTLRVNDIAPDTGGRTVWAATDGGLLAFSADGAFLREYGRADGLGCHNLQALHVAPDGAVWIASLRGVIRFREGRFTTFTTEQGLNDNRVYAIAADASGRIYAGTHKGVGVFDGAGFAPLDDSHEFARRAVKGIHRAADGTLWFAKENALSHYLGGNRWAIYWKDSLRPGPRTAMGSQSPTCVATDAQGSVWAGTTHGLSHLAGEAWKTYEHRPRFDDGRSPRCDGIAALSVDRDGWVWVGYGDGGDDDRPRGVTYFKGDLWHHLTSADGLISDRVYRIRTDGENRKWMATAAGGMSWREGKVVSFRRGGSLPANQVTEIGRVEEGVVAIRAGENTVVFDHGRPVPEDRYGTSRIAAALLESGSRKRAPGLLRRPEGLRGVSPVCGLTGGNGRLWIGTAHHGLFRYEESPGRWARCRLGGNDFPDEITALCLESEDVLWVGTASEGAMRVDLADRPE